MKQILVFIFLMLISNHAYLQSASIKTKLFPKRNIAFKSIINHTEIVLKGITRNKVYILARFCEYIEDKNENDEDNLNGFIRFHPKSNPNNKAYIEVRLKSDSSKIIASQKFDCIDPMPILYFYESQKNHPEILHLDSLKVNSTLKIHFQNYPDLDSYFEVERFRFIVAFTIFESKYNTISPWYVNSIINNYKKYGPKTILELLSIFVGQSTKSAQISHKSYLIPERTNFILK